MGFPLRQHFGQPIPGNHPLLRGKTIKGMRFRCQGTSTYLEAKAWVSTPNPDSCATYDIQNITLDPSSLRDSVWNEVALNPVAIPEEGIWVGWSKT